MIAGMGVMFSFMGSPLCCYRYRLNSLKKLWLCHSPVDIHASAHAGVCGKGRECVEVSGSVWK